MENNLNPLLSIFRQFPVLNVVFGSYKHSWSVPVFLIVVDFPDRLDILSSQSGTMRHRGQRWFHAKVYETVWRETAQPGA